MQKPQSLTFARFISVPECKSALMAMKDLAACYEGRPSKVGPNPLYLHGPAGTGKTHLVSALVQEVVRNRRNAIVVVIQAGNLGGPVRFAEEAELGDNGPEQSLQAARQADLLIVEDVQHLPASACERSPGLVQVFDELLASGCHMVFTASVDIGHLDLPSRLTSRLSCGLVIGLEPMQPASRMVFLQEKAQRRQLAVGSEVLAWLAKHLNGGGRQLDGAIVQLETLSRGSKKPLDVLTVAEHFREQIDAVKPTIQRIVSRVGSHFHVEPRHLRSGRRTRSVLLPRQIGMYLARRLTSLSYDQIGAYFGDRDHTTVLHACRKVEKALDHDDVLSGTIRQLHSTLS